MSEIPPEVRLYLMSGVGLIILITVILIGLAWLYVVRIDRRKKWLKANGRPAPAKLIKFIPNGRGIGTGSNKKQGVDLIFEVQPADAPPYQVVHREQLNVMAIAKLTPDTMFALRLDPDNPQKITIDQWPTL